jgi:hypothetical protein
MKKLLIGPVLTGVGWLAGSHYGAEAQQLVHKSPDETYAGVAHAIDAIPIQGTTSFEGGKPMPYTLNIERNDVGQDGRQLIVHVLFDGKEGGWTEIDFASSGQDTLVTAKAHGDRSVLSEALAGTAQARLAYAPDWMLNLVALRPLLKQLGEQIEKGQPVAIGGMSEADWEASLPPDQQKQVQDYRQYAAAAPTLDPDADARNYMQGAGGN